MPLDAVGVDRPHPPQQLDALVGERDLERAAVVRVGLAADAAGRLDAVDEAAHRGRAQHDLVGELLHAQAAAGLPVERPQQVVPAQVGEPGLGQVAADRARDPRVGVEEGAPGGELLVVDLRHAHGSGSCTCIRCTCMYSCHGPCSQTRSFSSPAGAAASAAPPRGASSTRAPRSSSAARAWTSSRPRRPSSTPPASATLLVAGQITDRDQAHALVAQRRRALRRRRRARQQHRHLPPGAVRGADRGALRGGARLDPAADLLGLAGRRAVDARARRRRDRQRRLDVGASTRSPRRRRAPTRRRRPAGTC